LQLGLDGMSLIDRADVHCNLFTHPLLNLLLVLVVEINGWAVIINYARAGTSLINKCVQGRTAGSGFLF
jgi:hypothetical protein